MKNNIDSEEEENRKHTPRTMCQPPQQLKKNTVAFDPIRKTEKSTDK